ncbi:MAG: hypothetical protein HQL19_08400 [Candidatus Omnitrophica bacterium]|nr:hypothetical protein [Candidatus Omnitrophota bacterium]
MKLQDIGNKIRQWDIRSNQWFSKNFSILIFELVLVVIFIFFIDNLVNLINISDSINHANIIERLMFSQSGLMLLIVLLLLFNSFLMLYLFNNMLRIRSVLKNMDFNLGRRKSDRRSDDE